MFIAIINESYVVVKEEMNLEKEDFEVGDFLKQGYNNLLVSLCIHDIRCQSCKNKEQMTFL